MIEYSSFLIVPAMISGVLLILIILFFKWTFKSKRKNIWIGFTVFFAFYLFIVCQAILTDVKNQKELNSFDLNKDGLFSGIEITLEQQAAMSRLTNDVGINFSVFTGMFIGLIMGFVAFWIAWGFDKYKRLKAEEETNSNTHL